jgi:hypothetical protein
MGTNERGKDDVEEFVGGHHPTMALWRDFFQIAIRWFMTDATRMEIQGRRWTGKEISPICRALP